MDEFEEEAIVERSPLWRPEVNPNMTNIDPPTLTLEEAAYWEKLKKKWETNAH